uniref:PX domain-containing protein n=1 Tax=Cryptomonas curvata TaxID=233186 RepID=A0A7S0QGV0_9CRYP|mmetsp:Transcript_35312/g.73940  ORF Transcript_35312/g.73940 Transcript_35312/m.73940 type:complete len:211 (+) Transcript_35312:116-748(+)|eukprot:CAMPEP_0172163742 /NCGR_PEP_ID=MMETSP1050-20130122/7440_1 /TAXON_ID=233186 /ORGANISM="Cryptomonas curvata, Strain CCAP979/52" /LENGTH=210 /DNA_ID=CAMNT_0012833965 /DNA_START=115 /DNA_END=747 /DNA_ORIENTATION=-
MVLQGVAAFGHIAPPVVVYAKQPTQQRGNRTLMCFPSEFTQYVFCVNAAGRKWDVSKRFRDFQSFERKLVRTFSESDLEGREPLPEKNFFLTNSPSFIEHRRWRLEMYINALAHCPVIAHSDVFKDFLEYDQTRETCPVEELDERLTHMTDYDREQERIKMDKLAALAKLPLRLPGEGVVSPSNTPSAANGRAHAANAWEWAGDALSLGQ